MAPDTGQREGIGQVAQQLRVRVFHEFRTPLGIIQSSAEILEDYPPVGDDRAQRPFGIDRSNTRRMAGIMEEVLLLEASMRARWNSGR